MLRLSVHGPFEQIVTVAAVLGKKYCESLRDAFNASILPAAVEPCEDLAASDSQETRERSVCFHDGGVPSEIGVTRANNALIAFTS